MDEYFDLSGLVQAITEKEKKNEKKKIKYNHQQRNQMWQELMLLPPLPLPLAVRLYDVHATLLFQLRNQYLDAAYSSIIINMTEGVITIAYIIYN